MDALTELLTTLGNMFVALLSNVAKFDFTAFNSDTIAKLASSISPLVHDLTAWLSGILANFLG